MTKYVLLYWTWRRKRWSKKKEWRMESMPRSRCRGSGKPSWTAEFPSNRERKFALGTGPCYKVTIADTSMTLTSHFLSTQATGVGSSPYRLPYHKGYESCSGGLSNKIVPRVVGHDQSLNNWRTMGSGYSTVGRGVASGTTGPRFVSSHRQFLWKTFFSLLLTV